MARTKKAISEELTAPHPGGSGTAVQTAAAASFAALLKKIDYLNDSDIDDVRKAYRFADEAHLGQMRKSGAPYITHPIAVAGLCADWKLDAQAIMAALMHDVLEDCGITKIEMAERFGMGVADLVDQSLDIALADKPVVDEEESKVRGVKIAIVSLPFDWP